MTVDGRTPGNRSLAGFTSALPFALDPFQLRACQALANGSSVLVAAPTGSGKTVVGEFAVHLALSRQGRAFYTTPIKALSNQKFRDFGAALGSDRVGLMTGDAVINPDAPVIVMTTEVLRNMLYEASGALVSLGCVVLDEVHYLADRERGAVWEEVILHLPDSVQVAALSATVSNAEQFGAWLCEVRGNTDVVVSEHRPVPLEQLVLTEGGLLDLFEPGTERTVNPELVRHVRRGAEKPRGGKGRGRGGTRRLWRPGVVHRLEEAGLLPALVFIFSRAACDDAVSQSVSANVRLTTHEERERIAERVDVRCSDLSEDDRSVLGFSSWRDALLRGLAAHHAGLLPAFKEVVEELFNAGLVRVVFATETLALGINMPARSVVLERLVKWDGQSHVEITPGEFTQLTGRAGRRGIDRVGFAVIAWHSSLEPARVAALASTRSYPLRSSFRPSYNMAVNLIRRFGAQAGRELLETSFAQYQADEQVVGLAARIRRQQRALEGYDRAAQCERGDFGEYWQVRRELSDIERAAHRDRARDARAAAAAQLAGLNPGDIIEMGLARRGVPAVVLVAADPTRGEPRPQVLTVDRRAKRISVVDVPGGVEVVGQMRLPRDLDPRSATWRRHVASKLSDALRHAGETRPARGRPRNAARKASLEERKRVDRLRKALREHPCHSCPDREDHARWWDRRHKLTTELGRLERRLSERTGSLAQDFDRVCALLAERGFLIGTGRDFAVTQDGRMLAALHAEQDLLTCEALREGVFEGLSPPALAAVCSALTFESRGDEESSASTASPRGPVRAALQDLGELAADLAEVETRYRLDFVRQPEAGLVNAALNWAEGKGLGEVLPSAEMTAGDFVRSIRRLVDILHQIAHAAAGNERLAAVGATARDAAALLRRGVVAYDST